MQMLFKTALTAMLILSSQANAEALKLCAEGPFFDGITQITRLDFARDCSEVIRRPGDAAGSGSTVVVRFDKEGFSIVSNLYGGWNADVYMANMSNSDYRKAVEKKWVGAFLRDNLESFSKYRSLTGFQSMINFIENLKTFNDPAGVEAFSKHAMAEQARQQDQQRLSVEADARRKREEEATASRRVADQVAQEAAQRDEHTQREKESSDLAKLRLDLAKMNAGQLFAKADELSSQGDTAKARETLRTLVSRFPNHPLVATAAQQMATMSSASANSGGNNSNTGSASNTAGQRVNTTQKGMSCRDALDELQDAFVNFFEPRKNSTSTSDTLSQYIFMQKKMQVFSNHYPACRDSTSDQNRLSEGLNSWQDQCRRARGSDCVNGRDLFGYGAEADRKIARLMSTPASTNNAQSSKAQSCDSAIAQQESEFLALNRRPVPQGATPPLMRVMWMTSEKIKLIRANCPNTAIYQNQIKELQSVYDQSDKACGQLTAGNACPGPNPYR